MLIVRMLTQLQKEIAMKHKSIALKIVTTVLAMGVFMASGAVLAQDQESTAQNLPPPQVDTVSCAQIQWAPQVVAEYPRMPQACHEVVMVDGVKWVRFGAKLVRITNNVALMDVQNPHGGSLGTFRIRPTATARIKVDGEEYSYWQIPKGHVLNYYIQEGKLGVATHPANRKRNWRSLNRASHGGGGNRASRQPPRQPSPETAGPLPWIALSGILLVVVGLGFTLGRRF